MREDSDTEPTNVLESALDYKDHFQMIIHINNKATFVEFANTECMYNIQKREIKIQYKNKKR